ncbi:exonuclease domain-containing protein [Streptomyces winkii]|uniref:exonuclease domain-containing protein n=1 Tax=Streptomyces winkii TaxID=3051178 RepID=UPI0028D49096|nr:exonuclease domain-containing protein [Streptomyces sp. DSM 40971]
MLEDQTAFPGEPEDGAARAGRIPAQSPAVGSGAGPVWPDGYPQGYAVVDVETTGLDRHDRIVSAAVYRLDARGEVEDHWYSTVNPQRDPGPTWIHGLTTEDLADAPLFTEIADDLATRLDGRVLVAHNAVFDWSMIAREYARARRTPPVRQRLCTIALAKQLSLPLPNHKLESLAAHYGVSQRHAHHALDDARVLAEAFRPSLHLAVQKAVRLPLHACRPLSEWPEGPGGASGSGDSGDSGGAAGPGFGGFFGGRRSWGVTGARPYRYGWRRSRKLPACPYPNPGRYEPGTRLVQGMRIAISGDTSVERELLEDRATEAGLHISSHVSRLTSLLVTNDPGALTSKVVKAEAYGTPVLDEAAFLQLLHDVAPAQER